MVTKPIPAKQVVDVLLDESLLACLGVECTDLPSVMGAVVDRICSSDIPSLDFGCLTAVVTQEEFFQLLITEICTIKESSPDVPSVYNYQFCAVRPELDCRACVSVEDPCNEGLSDQLVIQSLIEIVNRQTIEICTLKDTITQLQSDLTMVQSQITNLDDCCN